MWIFNGKSNLESSYNPAARGQQNENIYSIFYESSASSELSTGTAGPILVEDDLNYIIGVFKGAPMRNIFCYQIPGGPNA